MGKGLEAVVRDPRRLDAWQRTALLDREVEGAFDRLTRLAARALHAPLALVSQVAGDRLFFKSIACQPDAGGAYRYLTKPVDVAAFLGLVDEFLRREGGGP